MFDALNDVIAFIALIFSAYATWTTHRFNQRQTALIESQEKLNLLLMQRGETEVLSERKADLGANFVKIGSSDRRLKIFNKGKGTARHVTVDFPDGNDLVSQSDVQRKFPLEALEQSQSVELIASTHLGSKGKLAVRLSWSDDAAEHNEKTLYPTV